LFPLEPRCYIEDVSGAVSVFDFLNTALVS
jgi:hypothetical protein